MNIAALGLSKNEPRQEENKTLDSPSKNISYLVLSKTFLRVSSGILTADT
jgi:hypothetical protein